MHGYGKRLLSFLLAMVMVFSLVPVQAFATESEHDHDHEHTEETQVETEPQAETEPEETEDGEDAPAPPAPPEVAQAKQRMQLSYTGRMIMQGAVGILALSLPCFHAVATVLPLLFPRLMIHLWNLQQNKQKEA